MNSILNSILLNSTLLNSTDTQLKITQINISFNIFQDLARPFKILQDLSSCVKILQYPSRSDKTLKGPTGLLVLAWANLEILFLEIVACWSLQVLRYFMPSVTMWSSERVHLRSVILVASCPKSSLSWVIPDIGLTDGVLQLLGFCSQVVSWVFLDEVGRGWLGDVRSVLNKVRELYDIWNGYQINEYM